MSGQFPNIDFSFRRGLKVGVENAPIKNGSLNFTVDSEEMFVDVDDKRLIISSVIFKETEADIRAIEVPGDKLYIATANKTMMMYDPDDQSWVYISDNTNMYYCTCTSNTDAQVKVVTCQTGNFALTTGSTIAVMFSNTNTFNSDTDNRITLNVNNTGNKEIYYKDTTDNFGRNPVIYGKANYLNFYIFNGTYWVWMGTSVSSNSWEGTLSEYQNLSEIDPDVIYFVY